MTAGDTRRDLAVARVLDPARERAEARVQRFLDAALELLAGNPNRDFTVQEVVERSGQSLRSFYQYFDGKNELLLALFEDGIRAVADGLEEVVAKEENPLAKLRCFCVEYHGAARRGQDPTVLGKKWPMSSIAGFAQQLMVEHPAEAGRAFAPLVELLAELVEGAIASGDLRKDIAVTQVVGTTLQVIMFDPFAIVIAGRDGRSQDAAENLWTMLFEGLRAQ